VIDKNLEDIYCTVETPEFKNNQNC
jgi:hypothetical protein